MILEGIVSTMSADGKINVAPMGPRFLVGQPHFELLPFESSTTYQNLLVRPVGVLHVTDDVLLFAKSAIGRLGTMPDFDPAQSIDGCVLRDCCQWFEFSAAEFVSSSSRKRFVCEIVAEGIGRRWYGFNRAKHMVIEASILATRIHWLPHEEIASEFSRLRPIVDKTGGPNEIAAFDLLVDYFREQSSPAETANS